MRALRSPWSSECVASCAFSTRSPWIVGTGGGGTSGGGGSVVIAAKSIGGEHLRRAPQMRRVQVRGAILGVPGYGRKQALVEECMRPQRAESARDAQPLARCAPARQAMSAGPALGTPAPSSEPPSHPYPSPARLSKALTSSRACGGKCSGKVKSISSMRLKMRYLRGGASMWWGRVVGGGASQF